MTGTTLKSWATQNSRGQIYASPTLETMAYYLRWIKDFDNDNDNKSEKGRDRWHRFCFQNPNPSVIGHLVVDFQLDVEVALDNFANIFTCPVNAQLQTTRRRMVLSVARTLKSLEVIFHNQEQDQRENEPEQTK